MPRITIRDYMGMAYTIDTTSWELIEQWLAEWAPRLTNRAAGFDLTAMRIWPLELADQRFDWPADTRFIGEPFSLGYTAGEALARLRDRKQLIEQQMKEAAADGR